ncbi:MAG: leucine-rich repeat domain-containing protein [Solobacterium sp.]|nr:leucine-rich repeat domain-containing protein [Solobacterium sp.]
MENISRETERDFVIDPSGVLTQYRGTDTEIVLPDTVRVIGEGVFSNTIVFPGYKNVVKLIIPEGVEEIQRCAFCYSDLEEIVLPSTLKIIGERAFQRCRNLKSITIPDGVTKIARGVFTESGLEEIRLPKGLQEIGRFAFYNCTNLRKVNFHEMGSVKIKPLAFVECKGLADDSGFCIFQNRLLAFDPDKYGSRVQVDLPDNIVYVEDRVFTDYDAINITMPLHCPVWRIDYNSAGWYSIIDVSGSSLSFRKPSGEIAAKVVLETEYETIFVQTGFMKSIRSKESGGFDFEQYDSFFDRLSEMKNKVKMAAVRLRYPYKLSEKMKEKYTSYLTKDSSYIGHKLIRTGDMETLRLLESIKIFNAEVTRELVEYAYNQKNYDFFTELLNYQKTEFGTENVFRNLKLPEDDSTSGSET